MKRNPSARSDSGLKDKYVVFKEMPHAAVQHAVMEMIKAKRSDSPVLNEEDKNKMVEIIEATENVQQNSFCNVKDESEINLPEKRKSSIGDLNEKRKSSIGDLNEMEDENMIVISSEEYAEPFQMPKTYEHIMNESNMRDLLMAKKDNTFSVSQMSYAILTSNILLGMMKEQGEILTGKEATNMFERLEAAEKERQLEKDRRIELEQEVQIWRNRTIESL
jgi:hypothetical protein